MRIPDIGDVFEDRYRIDGLLGEGGFGTVFAAIDLEWKRPVALKLLKPDQQGGYASDTRARFWRELQIVANLQSAHTVVLFDGGKTADGLLYMVFERVPGEDLSELLAREGRLPPQAVLHIVWQLLDSLAEAHENGLLHRDLKPENIRVFEYQDDPLTVKLLDFGLARAVDARLGGITSTGQMIGTPRYMAPEQLTERPLSPATDIYSLGMMMLEMLFGREALHGNRLGDQLHRLRSGHVFSVPEMDRVGPELVAIIGRMTARNSEDRYQSAARVCAALEQPPPVQARQPAPIPPPAADVAPRAPAREPEPTRWPSRWWLVVPIAVVLVLGLLVRRPSEPQQPESKVGVSHVPNALVKSPVHDAEVGHTADVPDSGRANVDTSPETPNDDHDAVRSAGCGGPPPQPGLDDFLVAGEELVRRYVPSKYDHDHAYPLTILLHQAGSNPDRAFRYSGFPKLAEEQGAVVIAPMSSPILTWMNGDEDVRQVRRAFQWAAAHACIDLSRVYVAGHGQGGHLARRMVCEPWIAAMATNSFRAGREDTFCDPDGGLRYLMLSPLNSAREPVDGGPPCGSASIVQQAVGAKVREVRSLEEAEDVWRKQNGCRGSRAEMFEYRGSYCYSWQCDPEFVTCHVIGGHDWPGSGHNPRALGIDASCDGEPPDFPTGEFIWNFLMASPPNEQVTVE